MSSTEFLGPDELADARADWEYEQARQAEEMEKGAWVLKNTLTSENLGKPICFQMMTGIGPCTSADPDEWMRFDSPEEAKSHPANFHALSFYEAARYEEVVADVS
jgi:hypothetical protein